MKKLIIIPAYNESANIEKTVASIKKDAKGFDYVIINDCSIDNTRKICEDNGFNIVNLPINLGIGATPAASACTTCARPISSPSSVIKEFSAIFWDLNGATRYPSCLNILQSPAHRRLFPALDIVPCIIIFPAMLSTFHSLLQILLQSGNALLSVLHSYCSPGSTVRFSVPSHTALLFL